MIESIPIHPEKAEFVLLSFEGPDRYAQAGGLGVRVTNLARALACKGFRTHLFFIGDPNLPGIEDQPVDAQNLGNLPGSLLSALPEIEPGTDGHEHAGPPVRCYRWGQWISRYYPNGVYQGEESKINDWNASLPPYVIEHIARPAIAEGRYVIVLAEEWHTAGSLILLSDQLHAAGLRDRCVLLWNANNTMGFEWVDWQRLSFAATITTVSRYMKQIMRGYGLDALIIPNGIPAELLQPLVGAAAAQLREGLAGPDTRVIFKVGRFDPAKCWWMAVEAAAELKRSGEQILFLARGGIEPHGVDVLNHARELGLVVRDVTGSPKTWKDVLELIHASGPADLYNLCFFMPQSLLRVFYAAADVVLANSKHEPFGLVGLEAMAVGGLVFTGPTGETYSADGEGAIALDTENAAEITLNLRSLDLYPELGQSIRDAAPKIAARYTWDAVLNVLFEKIELAASQQQTRPLTTRQPAPARSVQDVVIYTVIHQPRRLRLPARPIPPGLDTQVMAECLFDEDMDRRYFTKVAERCYYPATQKFIDLAGQGDFKLTIGFSMSFLAQAQRFDPQLFELFRELVQHPNVELSLVEPYHSFLLMWDVPGFVRRMREGRAQLTGLFGKAPQVADTTEMMMSDTIYHALDGMGMKGAFFDGRPWVMGWRQPTYLYTHGPGQMRLLARHYSLSDDVGYRFSNRGWPGWPLMADTYAGWLAGAQGDLVTIGWDYETFGEHHSRETGIFDFMDALAREVPARGLRFRTASEAIEGYESEAHELPLSPFHSTWAGSGGLDFFLGNPAQQAVFQLMMSAYNKALLTNRVDLIDLALWLAMSDNLHLIQWYGRQGSEAEVSAYFTPREWWQLGPDRIIGEIQRVYMNFIAALDEALEHPRARQQEAWAVLPTVPVRRERAAELAAQ